jgi:hypothetical protein
LRYGLVTTVIIKSMTASEFQGYFGHPDFHDAVIEDVQQSERQLSVVLRAESGARWCITFAEAEVTERNPRGTRIYAVSRMATPRVGLLTYVFVNWNERDDSPLEVTTSQEPIVRAVQ